jgi:hypothetical protein
LVSFLSGLFARNKMTRNSITLPFHEGDLGNPEHSWPNNVLEFMKCWGSLRISCPHRFMHPQELPRSSPPPPPCIKYMQYALTSPQSPPPPTPLSETYFILISSVVVSFLGVSDTAHPACCRSGSLGPRSWVALRSATDHSPVLLATLPALLSSELMEGVLSLPPGNEDPDSNPVCSVAAFLVTFHFEVA